MNHVGNVLKEARESKGLTIDDIQTETKIQKRYLEYIERGKLDELPGNFYAKAFVKQYAEAVGLDSAKILSHYKDEFPEDKKDLAAREMYNRAQRMNSQEDFKSKIVDGLPKIMLICFIVIIVIAGYYFFMSNSNDSDSTSTDDGGEVVYNKAPEEEQEPNVNDPDDADPDETDQVDETVPPVEEVKQEIVPVSIDGDVSTYELKNAPVGDYKVTLSATADCWFEVTDQSGTSLYNGVVTPDAPKEVVVPAASTEIIVDIGNAGGGKVAVNGVEVVYQLPPENGQLQTLVVKPVATQAQ